MIDTFLPYSLREAIWTLYTGLLPGWEEYGMFEVNIHLHQESGEDWFVMATPLEDKGTITCLTLVGNQFTHLNEDYYFPNWNAAVRAFERAAVIDRSRKVS